MKRTAPITAAPVTRGFGLLERFLSEQRSKRANELIPLKSRQGRILDIGCGTTPMFLLNTEFREKYGIDKVARLNNDLTDKTGVVLHNHDVEIGHALPYGDSFFDVITMLAVFEHIEPNYLPGLLHEIHRVLRPGGVYILTTPAPWTPRLLTLLAKMRLLSALEIYEHKNAYRRATIARFLEEAGFSDEHMTFGYFELGMNIWGYASKST
jgi:SAM-dependent methyltransferase